MRQLRARQPTATQTPAQGTHLVSQRTLQRVAQVLGDAVDADAAHGADSQRADQRARVARVLLANKPNNTTRLHVITRKHHNTHQETVPHNLAKNGYGLQGFEDSTTVRCGHGAVR